MNCGTMEMNADHREDIGDVPQRREEEQLKFLEEM